MNGFLVDKIEDLLNGNGKVVVTSNYNCNCHDGYADEFIETEIHSIVTKEQFEEMEYTIKE